MVTRNLVAVHYKGQYRIAQYGQWDGYPDGQGNTVLEFLSSLSESSTMNPPVEAFKENLMACSWMEQADYDAIKNDPILAKEWIKRLPHLSRDTGAGVLAMVMKEPLKLRNSISFAGESLFCEWAYVIDFDANTFEVFKGFNHSPLKNGDRFYGWPTEGEYQPVRLVKSYPLDHLPSLSQMMADCSEGVDE